VPLRWNSVPATPEMTPVTTRRRADDARPLPKRTLERLAACEAVGLHWWADHPTAHHVWAVDDHQQVHAVRINRDGTAQHVCGSTTSLVATEQCAGNNEAASYATPNNIDNFSPGEQQMTTQKDRPTQGEAVQDTQANPYQEGSPMPNVSQPASDLPI